MSFLLKKTGGVSRDANMRSLPPPHQRGFGLRRTSTNGAGTAQIMQQKQVAVQNEASTVQGVALTMAEVMKDLRILEEQQKEAEQKLQQARQTKQRRQTMLSTHEAQTQELKYRNGQQRAQLQRMYDLLGQGQRSLGFARDDANKARRDLEDLEQAVRVALETRRSNLAWDRRHERKLDMIQDKSNYLQIIFKESQGRVHQLRVKLSGLKHKEEQLQEACQIEASKSQSIAQETANIRSESSLTENDIDSCSQARAELHRIMEEVKGQIAAADEQHQDTMSSLDSELETQRRLLEELTAQEQDKREHMTQSNAELQKCFGDLVQIQQAEGHPISKHPHTTSETVVLNMERVRESVKAEAKAAIDEATAKSQLQSEVAQLQQDITDHQIQEEESSKSAAEFVQTCQDRLNKEKERKQFWKEFVGSYTRTQKQVEVYRETIEGLRDRRDEELKGAREHVREVKDELRSAQRALGVVEGSLNKSKSDMETVQEAFTALQHTHNGATLADIKSKALLITEQLDSLREESKRLLAEKGSRASHEESKDTSEVELERKTTLLLNEYPALRRIEFVYDSSLTFEEHKKACLSSLITDCNKRIDSARKMAKDLFEAEELEKEERKKVELAAQADYKRKEETRQQRSQNQTDQPQPAVDEEKEHKRMKKKMKFKEKLRMKFSKDDAVADPEALLSEAKPRTLLSSYGEEAVDSAPSPSQKKVHWHDQGADETAPLRDLSSHRQGHRASGKQDTEKELTETQRCETSSKQDRKSSSYNGQASHIERSKDESSERTRQAAVFSSQPTKEESSRRHSGDKSRMKQARFSTDLSDLLDPKDFPSLQTSRDQSTAKATTTQKAPRDHIHSRSTAPQMNKSKHRSSTSDNPASSKHRSSTSSNPTSSKHRSSTSNDPTSSKHRSSTSIDPTTSNHRSSSSSDPTAKKMRHHHHEHSSHHVSKQPTETHRDKKRKSDAVSDYNKSSKGNRERDYKKHRSHSDANAQTTDPTARKSHREPSKDKVKVPDKHRHGSEKSSSKHDKKTLDERSTSHGTTRPTEHKSYSSSSHTKQTKHHVSNNKPVNPEKSISKSNSAKPSIKSKVDHPTTKSSGHNKSSETTSHRHTIMKPSSKTSTVSSKKRSSLDLVDTKSLKTSSMKEGTAGHQSSRRMPIHKKKKKTLASYAEYDNSDAIFFD